MVNGRRWLCFFLGLVFIAAACPRAQAQGQNPGVAVLPFVIHGQKDVQKTRQAVEEILLKQLEAEGIRVMKAQEVERVVKPTEVIQTDDQGRAAGRRLQTDFVLMGSYNEIGGNISLDARLVDVSGRKQTEVMFAEEKGLENLAAAVGTIVKRLSVPLLSKAIIADVKVRGNERIEAEAIKANVKSRKGDVLRPQQVREDIRSVYKMGFFENVDADVTDTPAGKELTFSVRENPSIQEMKITGNKKLKEKDILAAVATKPHTVLQESMISDDVQKILKLYQQKAYYNAEVTSSIEYPKDPRRAVVTFKIKENNKVYIKRVDFTGNKRVSTRKLRGVMQSKKANILSYFTDRGVLQRDVLDTDVDRVAIYYHDQGFMDVKVGSPKVDLKKDGFYITVPVEEGERYRVSDVKVTGDPLDEKGKKLKLETKSGAYFSREKLRNDLDSIGKTYMNEGYAHTDVNPDVKKDTPTLKTSVDYQVARKDLVYIGKISVSGNTKTRDYVIRREMKLMEGDLYSSKKLEDSMTSLKKLDYFEDVEIVPTEDPQQPGIMNLTVKVKEKLTGAISVGGGYSSEDGLFASGSIEQRNLWGMGHLMALKAYFGASAQRYMLSYTDPWFMGYHVAVGSDLYKWDRDYSDFTRRSTGGRIRSAFPFGEYSRINAIYTLEQVYASDIPDNASDYLKSMEGKRLKSAVTLGVERDTTDHPFLPTKGSVNSLSMEATSKYMGSDLDYVRFEAHSGIYVPLFWKFIGFLRGEIGSEIQTRPGNDVPIYEHYFLGGINSLRAFSWGDVGPKNEKGEVVGGLSYVVMNAELLFPLIEKLNMRGVTFFDVGNVYSNTFTYDFSDLRTDAGLGIRWQSPFGPLRIEWGYNLDRRPGEDKYKWQFSAGAFF